MPGFIKIDVEGLGADVLGCHADITPSSPGTILGMHGETINEKNRKVLEIVELLIDIGYEQ